ncbi:MAG: ATP-binding cassette domain-containing protein [Opitutales bacterium]|nr:ATP-binding cassette domain-containing protein [Opitutales bacterium]
MTVSVLKLEDLSLRRGEKIIFEHVSSLFATGEVHVLSGVNGAGKSSLLQALIGNPQYALSGGRIWLDDKEIQNWAPEKRAQHGLFAAFQSPCEIEGLTVANFLRSTLKFFPKHPLHKASATDFYKELYSLLEAVGLPKTFTARAVNVGFSGGEKKRFELLQLKFLRPQFALLDEIDSGLDAEARELVLQTVRELRPTTGFIIVSHNEDFAHRCEPTAMWRLENGRLHTV